MREHNPETVIRTLKYLLDGSNDVLSSNAVSSTHGCLYYDVHNSLIDAVSLLGGDVAKSELDEDSGIWELQEDSTWKNVQGEMDT